jgi:polysaccharide pyruvyl transferase WcaK-like protein
MNQAKRIGILGHYGNQNLGDEAIIEAMIANIKRREPGAIFKCISINPQDSSQRYNVDSFPLRYRKEYFVNNLEKTNTVRTKAIHTKKNEVQENKHDSKVKGIRQIVKQLPIIGFAAKAVVASIDSAIQLKGELYFLTKVKRKLNEIDLLIVCGSNQFLDNFGGAWGFPYTLLKWTILAKYSGTKVAFASIGAGPLTHSLSYKMLKIALSRADYLSYRDVGSKQLVESRLKTINGKVCPDIAHSLPFKAEDVSSVKKRNEKIVGINPMPVYDRRYWFEYDDEKYNAYVVKMATLCSQLIQNGYQVKLFGTQKSDTDVIDDVVNLLENDNYEVSNKQLEEIKVEMDQTVSGLMQTINSCDVIFATRFHATVLSLMLNKPVVGICYYRKSSELLTEAGLGDFHVSIDDFSCDELVSKFTELMKIEIEARKLIAATYGRYEEELEEQYESLLKIANCNENVKKKKYMWRK